MNPLSFEVQRGGEDHSALVLELEVEGVHLLVLECAEVDVGPAELHVLAISVDGVELHDDLLLAGGDLAAVRGGSIQRELFSVELRVGFIETSGGLSRLLVSVDGNCDEARGEFGNGGGLDVLGAVDGDAELGVPINAQVVELLVD